jgi:hypothetical protein
LLSLALGLAIGSLGCKKLTSYDIGAPTLAPTPIPMRDAIPLEYGELVGVSPGDAPGWALLFFQRADKSIVAVYVNAQLGMIAETIVEIPRR